MCLTYELRLVEKYGFLWFALLWKTASRGSGLSSAAQVAGRTCFTSPLISPLRESGSTSHPYMSAVHKWTGRFPTCSKLSYKKVWSHLLANDALGWFLYTLLILFFSFLMDHYYSFLNPAFFLLVLITFLSENKWGIKCLSKISVWQVCILFIMILKLGLCHSFPLIALRNQEKKREHSDKKTEKEIKRSNLQRKYYISSVNL